MVFECFLQPYFVMIRRREQEAQRKEREEKEAQLVIKGEGNLIVDV